MFHEQPLLCLEHVDSTNAELKRRLRTSSLPNGMAMLAAFQSAGRGRLGREWHSPAGANLLCSFWVHLDMPLAGIAGFSLLPSLAVLDALDAIKVYAGCKWPNDIRFSGRKLAGILTECLASAKGPTLGAIVGVGLNIMEAPSPIPNTTGEQPISLWEISGQAADPKELCIAIRNNLLRRTASWRAGKRSELFREWLSRCDHLYREVQVTINGIKTGCIMRGLGQQGQLLVDADGRREEIWIDDVIAPL